MMGGGKIPLIRLREIAEMRRALDVEEADLVSPLVNDCRLIPKLYKWYEANATERDAVMFRKKFVFLALCLFSMRTLTGCRMPKGMRAKLKQIFPDLASGCSISNYMRNLVVEYLYYPDFHEDIDRLYSAACEELSKHNGALFDTDREKP